jgi:hypothetical protein
MLRLGERVFVVDDSIEQNLPVGDYGYIIAYDRSPDSVFDYVIRVPKMNKHFYVPASDIELESVILQEEAERIEKEALIDFALATHNAELFRRVMNDDEGTPLEEAPTVVQSREEFVRQINLRAWI